MEINETKPDHFEFGFLSVAAIKKIESLSPLFKFFRSEVVEGGFLLHGCERKIISRGKNKDKFKYDKKNVRRVIVTAEEIAAIEKEYQENTGLCVRCLGSGQVFASWSVDDGKKYKPCKICSGSGKAVNNGNV